MNNKEYDLIVYIGRFQPFHVAHQKTIEHAFTKADNVLVLVGSSSGARTIRNPWTYNERKDFIVGSFREEYFKDIEHNLNVIPCRDFTYDDNKWIANTAHIVNTYAEEIGAEKIAVIGHDKDSTSYYLNYFQWKFVTMEAYPPVGDTIDATKIRRLMFEKNYHFVKSVLPANVYRDLFEGRTEENREQDNYALTDPWINTAAGKLMFSEWEDDKEQRQKWAGSPYPPIFVTADAVVCQSGCVLLVRRKGFPGYGQWAMPGGFVEQNERIRTAVLRELVEETRIKLPWNVMDRAIDAYEMFDDPERSTRGRTITHTYRITLDPTQKLPKVRGDGTETFEAKWFTLDELNGMEEVMFEDHYHVIKHMLAITNRPVRV